MHWKAGEETPLWPWPLASGLSPPPGNVDHRMLETRIAETFLVLVAQRFVSNLTLKSQWAYSHLACFFIFRLRFLEKGWVWPDLGTVVPSGHAQIRLENASLIYACSRSSTFLLRSSFVQQTSRVWDSALNKMSKVPAFRKFTLRERRNKLKSHVEQWGASLVAQWQRIQLPMQETWEMRVRSLSWDDALEKEMATHSRGL